MKIEIRKATIENLDSIKELNLLLFKEEYKNFDKTLDLEWPEKNKKYFKDAIIKKNELALVAIVNNKIVGYLIAGIKKASDVRNINKISELEDMLILKKYRGKGIGSRLMKKFIKWTKSKNTNRIKVEASAQNDNTINFYRKSGFKDYSLILEADLR